MRRHRSVQTLIQELLLQRVYDLAAGGQLFAVEPAQILRAAHDLNVLRGHLRILQLLFQIFRRAEAHRDMVLSGFFGGFAAAGIAGIRLADGVLLQRHVVFRGQDDVPDGHDLADGAGQLLAGFGIVGEILALHGRDLLLRAQIVAAQRVSVRNRGFRILFLIFGGQCVESGLELIRREL